VEITSLAGRLTAQRRRLQDAQARHDVSVSTIKFRPSTSTNDERACLGKLVVLDEGLCSCCLCPSVRLFVCPLDAHTSLTMCHRDQFYNHLT